MKTTKEFHSALGQLTIALEVAKSSEIIDWLENDSDIIEARHTPSATPLIRLIKAAEYLLEQVQVAPISHTGDPSTSREAAETIDEDQLRTSQRAVLRLFQISSHPYTDEMVAENYPKSGNDPAIWPRQSPSGLRTRRKELTTLGFLDRIGTTKNKAGRKVGVYALTDAGQTETLF